MPRSILHAAAALALAVFMTWPLASDPGALGRTGIGPNADARFATNGDGLFSLWNVAWVARTVVADPVNLFQANIFYPHRNALAYSEANLVAGVLGAPVWWATRNPYAALNSAILIAFASAWFFMWKLVRYLTNDWTIAATAATFYAFCPYVFAHTAHIQLMMTGGIPLALLMMHKLADDPSPRRGVALGAALLLQALACAYYGIFAGLMVGYFVVFFTVSRSLLRNRRWWTAVAVGAAVAVVGVAPFFYPYYGMRQEQGFGRALHEAVRYSANVTSYLASSAYAHTWLLRRLAGWPQWKEVMFPGVLPIVLAVVGVIAVAFRVRSGNGTRRAETVLLYGSVGVLAVWASFGPAGGLYTLLYRTIPVFAFLRAPSRLGIVVVLCLAVVAAIGLKWLLALIPRWRTAAGLACAIAAVAELSTKMPWERALLVPGTYQIAGTLPRGPLAEFPFYGERAAWHLHTQYMAFSTTHWMPMMNGYSDYAPPQFRQDANVLDGFPSDDSFAVLQRARIRYIGVHWDMFGPRAPEIRDRLRTYRIHLRPVAASTRMSLYEILSFP